MPPHVDGCVHAPQSTFPPQPSAMLPQSLPWAPQLDGRQPHWDQYMRSINFPNYDRLKKCDESFYEYCTGLFE